MTSTQTTQGTIEILTEGAWIDRTKALTGSPFVSPGFTEADVRLAIANRTGSTTGRIFRLSWR